MTVMPMQHGSGWSLFSACIIRSRTGERRSTARAAPHGVIIHRTWSWTVCTMLHFHAFASAEVMHGSPPTDPRGVIWEHFTYRRWEGYQWIDFNEYMEGQQKGTEGHITDTINYSGGDRRGVKTSFISNSQVLKLLLLIAVNQFL